MGRLISWTEIFVFIYECKTLIFYREIIWKFYHLLRFIFDLILQAIMWRCHRLSFWYKWLPRISSGDKYGRCVLLATFPPFCADFLEILGASNSWIPSGVSRHVQGKIYIFHFLRLCSVCCRCLKYQWWNYTYSGKEKHIRKPVPDPIFLNEKS
jgi:hypothetical protein